MGKHIDISYYDLYWQTARVCGPGIDDAVVWGVGGGRSGWCNNAGGMLTSL